MSMDKHRFASLTVGFIGGGNMASAIGAGLIRKGILNPDKVWVSARTNKTLKFWNDLGAHATLENGEVVDNSDIIFLAMKPNMLYCAVESIQNTITKEASNKIFVSVLLGVTLEVLEGVLRSFVKYPIIIRCMPNTPMMVGEGITVYCSMNTTNEDETMIESLFSYIGVTEKVPESLMNAIGGLSGSGPAYAYLVMEALADGAVKMGVPRPMATKFAAHVLIGAGKMVLETGRHPGQLKDEVCSPGGTTIAGIHAMECGQVRASMINAVQAAVNRSDQLASEIVKNQQFSKRENH